MRLSGLVIALWTAFLVPTPLVGACNAVGDLPPNPLQYASLYFMFDPRADDATIFAQFAAARKIDVATRAMYGTENVVTSSRFHSVSSSSPAENHSWGSGGIPKNTDIYDMWQYNQMIVKPDQQIERMLFRTAKLLAGGFLITEPEDGLPREKRLLAYMFWAEKVTTINEAEMVPWRYDQHVPMNTIDLVMISLPQSGVHRVSGLPHSSHVLANASSLWALGDQLRRIEFSLNPLTFYSGLSKFQEFGPLPPEERLCPMATVEEATCRNAVSPGNSIPVSGQMLTARRPMDKERDPRPVLKCVFSFNYSDSFVVKTDAVTPEDQPQGYVAAPPLVSPTVTRIELRRDTTQVLCPIPTGIVNHFGPFGLDLETAPNYTLPLKNYVILKEGSCSGE
jgi:hypothetical protein